MYMWSKEFFIDYMKLFAGYGVNAMEFILATADAMLVDADSQTPSSVGLTFQVDSHEDLCAYWSSPEPLERPRRRDLGKLNSSYGYKLISNPDDFLAFLRAIATNLLGPNWTEAELIFDNILRFTKTSLVDIMALAD